MSEELFIGRELHDALPRLLAQTRKNLRICAYELNPTTSTTQHSHQPLITQLAAISQSAVSCQIVLATSSKSANIRVNNHRAAELLTAHGWHVRLAKPHPLQHCKIWLLDDWLAVIGSHNLTVSGLLKNHEISVTCTSTPILAKLHRFFNASWESSTPI